MHVGFAEPGSAACYEHSRLSLAMSTVEFPLKTLLGARTIQLGSSWIVFFIQRIKSIGCLREDSPLFTVPSGQPDCILNNQANLGLTRAAIFRIRLHPEENREGDY